MSIKYWKSDIRSRVFCKVAHKCSKSGYCSCCMSDDDKEALDRLQAKPALSKNIPECYVEK